MSRLLTLALCLACSAGLALCGPEARASTPPQAVILQQAQPQRVVVLQQHQPQAVILQQAHPQAIILQQRQPVVVFQQRQRFFQPQPLGLGLGFQRPSLFQFNFGGRQFGSPFSQPFRQPSRFGPRGR